jgi:hypothetical protein
MPLLARIRARSPIRISDRELGARMDSQLACDERDDLGQWLAGNAQARIISELRAPP